MSNRVSRIISDVFAGSVATRDFISRRRAGDPHTIALYAGFGAQGRLLVHGRALEDEGLVPAASEHTRWHNMLAMLSRADVDALANAVVRVSAGSASVDVVADDEGFFSGWLDVEDAARIDDDWVRVEAQLVSPASDPPVTVAGSALMPVHSPDLMIISDVDDTVLQSNVTNLLRAARTLAFGNARTRLPFPGVAEFYHALRRGPRGDGRNPLFYVSSSPWNLYDVIVQFLEIQGIPAGPLMLRDVDIGFDTLASARHHDHKREMIRRVLSTFAGVPAILIGDSGQQDPEIYREVVHEFTGRIRAVYIRNVTPKPDRARAIQALADEVLAAGSSLVLADDTLAAARHAADHGFIAPDSLGAIGEEKKADEGITPEKADAPEARDARDEPTPTIVVEGN